MALATGGDSGIGKAVCYCFAIEGATVAFTYVRGQEDKDKDVILTVLKEARRSHVEDPLAIAADIGSEENCRSVVDQVVERFGRMDILVDNAAEQYLSNSVDDITEPWLERVLRTNIFSVLFGQIKV